MGRRRLYDSDEEEDENRKKRQKCAFIDDTAVEADDDDEDEDEEAEDGFIAPNDDGDDGNAAAVYSSRPPLRLEESEDEEDFDELERILNKRYSNAEIDYDDGDGAAATTAVDQQALVPSIKDPKLWMVKCAMGRERELAVCLMQKAIDRKDLQILSAIALDQLQGYVYVEAYKEAHVREACKGFRSVYGSAKIMNAPVHEMTAVLTVKSKPVDVSTGAWARVKIGAYKGDLAKVVHVDNVRKRITLKLVPRIDLPAVKAKLEGREVVKKMNKSIRPPQRFVNRGETEDLRIPIVFRDGFMGFRDGSSMKFRDGFLYKAFSEKSISTKDVHPTLDELKMFHVDSDKDGAAPVEGFGTLRKRHFLKDDRVVVIKGDLKNLQGTVQKVEGHVVHIKPCDKGLPSSIALRENQLCKCFEPGNQVKAVAGAEEGATGMVVCVEGDIITLVSDVTKKPLCVFADDIVESSEVIKKQVVQSSPQGMPSRDHDHPPQPTTRIVRPGLQFGGRFGGGGRHSKLVGTSVKIRGGAHKGCNGIVKEVKGNMVRVELEAQMRVVMVYYDQIVNADDVSRTQSRESSRYGPGSETPVYRSQTPLRPCMTPLRPCMTPARDYGAATPVHEGMRTPMRHKAWDPYASMTPVRDILPMDQY